MATDAPTPAAAPAAAAATAPADGQFDIVATYKTLSTSNPDLTKSVVAMKALLALLEATPASTAHETIKILTAAQATLAQRIAYPKALVAGAKFFQLFVKQKLRESDGDFAIVRQNLLTEGAEYVQRAVDARDGVAEIGKHYVCNGFTVLTYGASRTVLAVLQRAREDGRNFRVIYVRDAERDAESDDYVARLRAAGIPTAAVRFSAALHAVKTLKPRVDRAFLGGEVICQDGGMIGRMGSAQIAQAVASCNIDVYLCGETHKLSHYLATRLGDVGSPQNIKVFTTDASEEPSQEGLLEFTVR